MKITNDTQKAVFFYIQGQIIDENDPLKSRVLAFWSKTGWDVNIKNAKKYRSEKVAKNAVSSLSNASFNKATKVEVKALFPPPKPEKPKDDMKIRIYSSSYVDADYVPSYFEFDDDGECVGDSTWDYPGSPYLNDDDDIY